MNVTVRPIGREEQVAARRLAVEPEQQDLVACVASSLATMARYPGSEALGVFADGVLVGFMMGQLLKGGDPRSTYLIWDLLVDRSHQRQGIGRAAAIGAVHHAATHGATVVTLAYDPSNAIARDLYRSIGFVETGFVNEDGEHEMQLAIGEGSAVEWPWTEQWPGATMQG